jgi:hypothetical protein
LEQWLVRTDDPMLDVFRKRGDAAVREAFVAAQEKEAESRRVGGRGKAKPKAAAKTAASKAVSKRNADWIALVRPPTIAPGKPVTVKIEHRLPAELGGQVLTVTLKGGPEGRRLDRKTVQASGQGTAEVTFDVPAAVPGNVVSFAVFVGEDFQTSPQHLQSDPIAVQ